VLLRIDFDLPQIALQTEEENQGPLQNRMLFFSQISLQNLAIHKIAVRPVAGGQVFFH